MTLELALAIAGYAVLIAVCFRHRGLALRTGWLLAAYLFVSVVPEFLLAYGRYLGGPDARQAAFALTLALQVALVGLLSFFALGWRGRIWWLGAASAWLLVLLVSLVALPGVSFALGQLKVGPAMAEALGGWVVFSAVLVLLSAYAVLAARLPLHGNRALFWLIALVTCLGGQAMTLSPSAHTAQLGAAAGLLGAAGLTYGVMRYRLFDVRDALRRGLGYLLSTLVVAAAVLLGLLLAGQFLLVGGTSGAIGVAFIALTLAFIFQPLWRASQRLIARYILGERADSARLLRDYSQAIGEILDVEQLATAAVGIISDVLEVRRGALLLVTPLDSGDMQLLPVRGMGQMSADERRFPMNSLVMRHFAETRSPLLQFDIDLGPAFRSLPTEERGWWHNLAMDVYVPIMGREQPIGILALGPKGTGDSFRAGELDLLATLAGQTAVALRNARMFDDLRQLNFEVNQLNDDLKRTNDRLQRLDQVKTDFITIASHELRTPLTQLRGYTDILAAMNEDGQLSPQHVDEIAGSLARASERLDQVISAMLDVSQIDVQAMTLSFVETSADMVLRFSIEKLAPAMRERRQTLNVRGVHSLPVLQADFQRLTQVFTNLLTNAIKFTPDGGKITITGEHLSARGGPGDFVEIVITDSGVGLDPKDQEVIFEKFYRVGNPQFHSTGSTKFMGAGPGLGLAIARGVVEAHGGRIWAESPGFDPRACPGSSFHIVLPLVPPVVKLPGDSPPGLDSAAGPAPDPAVAVPGGVRATH